MAKRADPLEITPEEFIALVEIAKGGGFQPSLIDMPPSAGGVALRACALLMFSRFGGGLSARQIAEKLNLSPPAVRSWRDAFERTVDLDRLTGLRKIQAEERLQADLFNRICEELERGDRRLNYEALAKDLRSEGVDVVRQQLRQIFDREITRRLGHFRDDFINGVPDLRKALDLATEAFEQAGRAEQEDMEAAEAICNEIMESNEGRRNAHGAPPPNYTKPHEDSLLLALGRIRAMISDGDILTVPYAICLPSKGGPISMFTTSNGAAALPRTARCGKRRRRRIASHWPDSSLAEFVEELRFVHGLGDEVLSISFPYAPSFSKTVAKSPTPVKRPDGWQGPITYAEQQGERLRRLSVDIPFRQTRSKNGEPDTDSIRFREKLGREISKNFPRAQVWCASAKSIAMMDRVPAMRPARHFRRFEKEIREITEKKDMLLMRDPSSPIIEILDQTCSLVKVAAEIEAHSTWFFQRWGRPDTLIKFLTHLRIFERIRLRMETNHALKTELKKYAPDPTPPNPDLLPDTRTQLNRIIEILPRLTKSGRRRVLDEVMRALKELTENPPSCFLRRLKAKDSDADPDLRERYKRQMNKVRRNISLWNKTISREQEDLEEAARGPFRRSFLSGNFTHIAEEVFHSKFRNVVFKDKNEAWQALTAWSVATEKLFDSERFLNHFCDG